MKFELYKDVVLTRNLPTERLKRGDIVKLVEHHPVREGEDTTLSGLGTSSTRFPRVGPPPLAPAVQPWAK
jgi:hypothetical protein